MNQSFKTLVILVFLGTNSIHAQTGVKPENPDNSYVQNMRLIIGLEGGINGTFSYRDFAHRQEYDFPYQTYEYKNYPNSGYSYGLSLQWNFRNRLSIRSGLSLDYKSIVSLTDYNLNYNPYIFYKVRQTSSFEYLTIPLMAKLTFGKKVQFFGNAGIFLAFLVKQNNHLETEVSSYFGTPVPQPGESYSNMANLRKLDAGISGGAGIAVPIGKHLLISAEWRHYLGLRNSWKPDYSQPQKFLAQGSLLLHTMGASLGIAYRFSSREN
jgi:hypothetical protein